MTKDEEYLMVAAALDQVLSLDLTRPGYPYVYEVADQRLEVWFCQNASGQGHAQACWFVAGKMRTDKRLLFNQNNRVGDFVVRIYRDGAVTAEQSQSDFARPIHPALPQGFAQE